MNQEYKRYAIIAGVAAIVYLFMETTIWGAKLKAKIVSYEPASFTGAAKTV